MKHLIEYCFFSTRNPYEFAMYEGKGIPEVLKWLSKTTYYEIAEDFNKPYIIDNDEDDFKLRNLKIICINKKVSKGESHFGTYSNHILYKAEIILEFDFFSPNEEEIQKNLLHEFLHIYEVYKRYENRSSKKLQWDVTQILRKLKYNYVNDTFLWNFIYCIYLTTSQEINARVAEVYSLLFEEHISDKEKLINILKNSSTWKKLEEIKNFKFENIDYEKCLEFFKEYHSQISTSQKFNIFKIPKNEKDVRDILKEYKIEGLGLGNKSLCIN